MNQSSNNRRQGSKGTSLRLRRRLTTFLKVTTLSVPAKLKFPCQSMSVAITPWCHSQSVRASPSSQIPVWLAATSPGGYTYICICWLAHYFGASHYRKIFEQIFVLYEHFAERQKTYHTILFWCKWLTKLKPQTHYNNLAKFPRFFFSEASTKDCSMEHKMKTISNSLHHVCNLVFHKHPRISSNWYWWHWNIWGWTSFHVCFCPTNFTVPLLNNM
jgi:hypothetical protein